MRLTPIGRCVWCGKGPTPGRYTPVFHKLEVGFLTNPQGVAIATELFDQMAVTLCDRCLDWLDQGKAHLEEDHGRLYAAKDVY